MVSLSAEVPSVPFLASGLISLNYRLPKSFLPEPVTIGDHVRRQRGVLGLSQEKAAAAIGVCRDALARWEVGTSNPDPTVMPAVIRFLGYDPQPDARSFAEFLNRTKCSLGLNQQELASALGVPLGSLNA
jgi:DNA-binding XRE family transcriptional regulator